jgi:GH24 family phage-related lysozyme (muramidase)
MMAQYFTTSPAGFELIERFEGLHKVRPDGLIEAYKIGNDPWTVGIGQTGKMPDGRPVGPDLIITKQEAYDALQYFVRNVTEPLVRKHFVAKTQHEFDALVSWTYNISASRLEAGKYTLPSLVNRKDRDVNSIVSKLLEYVATPGFENGLYRRRLAEALMFMGLPWKAPAIWGYISTAIYMKGGVRQPTDPWFIFDMAQALVERPPEKPPEPPKPAPAPAPAPKPAPKAETPPEAPKEAPAKPVEKKPPAPSTKKPEEVGLDPTAGLKHVSESDRAKGWMLQQFGVMLLRLASLGMLGNGAAVVAQTLMADATLMAAAFELAIPLALNGSALAGGYVSYWYGRYKEDQGRRVASQPLYV